MIKYIVTLCLLAVAASAQGISIEGAYQKALGYEAELQSNKYQTAAKKDEIQQAKSRLYPKFDMSASATWGEYELKAAAQNRREEYSTLTLSSSVALYHPENFNLLDQAKLKHIYAELGLKALQQDLAYKVSDAYIAIIRAKNSLSVAKAYEELNHIKYKQIAAKYEKRLANKMDLLQSKVSYQQSVIKVKSEKRNLRLAKYSFKNLTGIADVTIADINLEHIDISDLVVPFEKKDLLTKNLEMQKADLSIAITKKEIQNSRYGWYPKADLSASLSQYDDTSRYRDYTREYTARVTISMPLFDGGYSSARVAQYKNLLSAAQQDRLKTKRDVETKYDDAVINLNTSRENIALYKETIESAKLYLYATNKAYEHGLTSLIDVEDAKARLFDAKFQLIDSVYNFMQAYTTLLNLYALFDEQKLHLLDNTLFGR